MKADHHGPSPATLVLALAAWMVATGPVAARSGESPSGGVAAVRPPVVVQQADDGTIVLSGSEASILGTTLRWEPESHKRTLGYWTRADDAAEWTFAIHATGEFEVEILQGCGTGQGGSEMTATLDPGRDTATTLRFIVEDTGGFQSFRPRTIGRLVVAEIGEHVLRVKPDRIAKQAACDIRQVRLVPAKPAAVPRP